MTNKRKGFTLIELLVVVLIIGILSAIALPKYTKAVERSRVSEVRTTFNTLLKSMALCQLENRTDVDCENNVFTDGDIGLGGELVTSGSCGENVSAPCVKTKDWIYSIYSGSSCDLAAKRIGGNYTLTQERRQFSTVHSTPQPILCSGTGCSKVCNGGSSQSASNYGGQNCFE